MTNYSRFFADGCRAPMSATKRQSTLTADSVGLCVAGLRAMINKSIITAIQKLKAVFYNFVHINYNQQTVWLFAT